MAPRRLVLAMLLLLAISTVIALMAPDPSERRQQESRQQTEAGTNEAGSGSRAGLGGRPESRSSTDAKQDPENERVGETIDLKPIFRTVSTEGPSPVIRVRSGQRVVLVVESPETIDVSIPALGRAATADRWAPAVFDVIIPARPRTFEVIGGSSGRPIARLAAD